MTPRSDGSSPGWPPAASAPARTARRANAAQPVAEGTLVAQGVPTRAGRSPLRHRRVFTHRLQAHRAEHCQGRLNRRRGGAGQGRRATCNGGSTSNPAASRRSRNSRQACAFAVPVAVYHCKCSHSVAANSRRPNPGSHATVWRIPAISSTLNTRPQWTQGPGPITPIAIPRPNGRPTTLPLILPESPRGVYPLVRTLTFSNPRQPAP